MELAFNIVVMLWTNSFMAYQTWFTKKSSKTELDQCRLVDKIKGPCFCGWPSPSETQAHNALALF